MPRHVHAELMMEYAKDALETDKPWERWEVTSTAYTEWWPLTSEAVWHSNCQYRRIDPYRELKEAAKNPKKQIRTIDHPKWEDAGHQWAFNLPPSHYQIRDKPYLVNGVEVPRPESEAPPVETSYFIPDIYGSNLYCKNTWTNTSIDIKWLNRGLVYLNKEDAIARAKLMLAEECRE